MANWCDTNFVFIGKLNEIERLYFKLKNIFIKLDDKFIQWEGNLFESLNVSCLKKSKPYEYMIVQYFLSSIEEFEDNIYGNKVMYINVLTK